VTKCKSITLFAGYTSEMKVLGIDPGYGRCGMAIVERGDGKDVLTYSACVETSANEDFPTRLAQVAGECLRLLEKHTPDAFAIEKLYFSNNQKTAMQVAEVRGALIQAASSAGVPVFEYTPGQIKSAVAGSGRADKKQIVSMLHLLIKIDKEIRHDDEYDAIAVAITHLAFARTPARVV
jgi:crossover junction endodeoxyribonuclease RuvC